MSHVLSEYLIDGVPEQWFGRYGEAALKTPVTTNNHGRDSFVPKAADEPHPLNQRTRVVMRLEDFSASDIAAIAASEAPSEASAFDDERND